MISRLFPFIVVVSSAYAGTVTGTLQGPSGMPIKNATLSFHLQQAGLLIGSGFVVPITASCYTTADGTVVGIPDPILNVISSVNTAAGSLPGGVYYVETTFYSGSAETSPSPEVRVQLTGAGTLTIAPPVSFPPNATGMKIYIATSSGSEQYQGETTNGTAQYSQAAALSAGAAPPVTNSSACSIAFNDTIIPYTGYNVSLQSSTGNAYPGWPQEWQLNGGSAGTVNISNGAPLWNGTIVYPQPIMAQPLNHGPQSISGPLGLSGYNLFNVGAIGFGTSTPGWPVDVENGGINASGGFLYSGAAPANHVLVGNGSAYVDSALIPSSALPPIYYQQVYFAGTPLPAHNTLSFTNNFNLQNGASTQVDLGATGVGAGSYTNPNLTIDNYGRITAASNGPAIPAIQTLVITTGICTTAAVAYGTCVFSPTWTSPFADSNYAVTCQAGTPSSGGSTSTATLYVTNKLSTGMTIKIQNGDTTSADATTLSEIDCIGVHP